MSTSNPTPPHVIEQCSYGILKVLSDGTVIRNDPFKDTPGPTTQDDDDDVLWKDVQFDPTHNLSLRLYKPRHVITSELLPVFFYFHGGGFCIGDRTMPLFHDCCQHLASSLDAIVVAPDYRLAPENRLPAAIEDAVAAVEWIRAQSATPDPFLADVADFGNIFVSGESAGGNIVHHLAVRLKPEKVIRGYILLCPFFGGTQRTESELVEDVPVLNLDDSDRFWRLSLPVGTDRDDPLANPTGPSSSPEDVTGVVPLLVVVAGLDLLRDRDLEYAERLKELGKAVEVAVFDDQVHGFLVMRLKSKEVHELVGLIRRFMYANSQRN